MSFWRLYYHLVWGTKNREPLLTPDFEQRLYPYLIGKAAELGAYVYALNGSCDHVHLVAAIPPDVPVAAFMKLLKGVSSHDLDHPGLPAGQFAWQRGYGALSLGESQRPIAEEYVAKQKQHHGEGTTVPRWEQTAEFDEGPADHGVMALGVKMGLHEDLHEYGAEEGFPF